MDPNTQRRQQERYQQQLHAYQAQQAHSHSHDDGGNSGAVVVFVSIGIAVAIIWFWIKKAGGGSTRSGLPARGILLQVSSTRGSSFGTGSTRVEYRQMRVDVEVPGQPAYEVSGSVKYPANLARDVLPGAQVELRVNKRNKNAIEIVGPAVGFSAAAQLTTTSQVRMQ